MKRPLVLVGFCYLLTLAAAVYFGSGPSLIFGLCCLFGFSVTFFLRRTRKAVVLPAAFLAAAVAFGWFWAYSRISVEPPRTLDGRDETIEGTVCELPYRQYDRWYYVVKIDDMEDQNAPTGFKVRLSTQNALDAGPYSKIRGTVHLFLPEGGNGYSSRSYYASKGIVLFAYLYEYKGVETSPPEEKPPYYYALRLRQALLGSVRDMLPPEEAGLVNGVLFGDVSGLSEQTRTDFTADGISHILSVSGLHMATIAELLVLFLLLLRVPKKPAAVAAGAGVLCFMAVTCFVPSVTRSGIMCLLGLFAPLFSRRADSLNSLAAAVLAVSLPNPYAAADVGLLLSFSATLGLILLSAPVSGYLNRKLDRIKALRPLVRGVNGVLATTAAAVLFTLPVILLSFGNVSLVAPLSNLLELVPSTLMIQFAAVAAVLNLVLPQSFLAMPFALAAGLLAKYMLACAHWLARLPYASFSASQGFVTLWLAGTLLLFALAFLWGKGRRLFRVSGCLSAVLLLVGVLSFQASERNVTRISVLDVGTGVSVAVTRNGHAAVVGCGGYSSGAIARYLESRNISRVDYLQVLTQEREEAVNSSELAQRFRPGLLVAQDGGRVDGFLAKAAQNSGGACWYGADASAGLWEDVAVETLSEGDVQAARITAGGITVLVCPGDADPALLPEDWRDSDFLVADSPPEKGAFRPVCTVLSMDRNEAAQELAAAKRENPAVATGGNGAVALELKRDGTIAVRRET